MTGFLVWLFIVFVSIVIYIRCNKTDKGRFEQENKNTKKEAKRQAKFKKDFWDRLKDKPVAFITEDGKQIFDNIWMASDALDISASVIWNRANTERQYTYEPKDSFEPVKHKFYWVNNKEKW
jgi:hypothetical protein